MLSCGIIALNYAKVSKIQKNKKFQKNIYTIFTCWGCCVNNSGIFIIVLSERLPFILAAGCTVIIKPSEYGPRNSGIFKIYQKS